MFSVRQFFLIVATAWAVTVPSGVPSLAQTGDAEALSKQFVELEQAGKYAEAIPLAQQLLAIYEKTFGPDHPNVAMVLNNLAELYLNQGRYADAEPLFKRSLAIDEKALGPDHPDVAMALNNLAALYSAQGRYADAEPLLQAVAGDPGKDARSRSSRCRDSAEQPGCALRQPRPLRRRRAALQAVAGDPRKSARSRSSDVAQSLNNLAELYSEQGRYAEAEPLYKRSLAIDEKALGPDHPDVASSLNNLAELYRRPGPLRRRRAALQAVAGDPGESARSRSSRCRAVAEQSGCALQRLRAATPTPSRSTSGRWRSAKRRSVPIIPMSRQSLNNLAVLYDEQGRYADAEPLYKRSLAIREKALGPDHPDVAAIAEQSGCALPRPRPLRRSRAALQAVAGDRGESARSRSSRCRDSR